MYLKSLFGKMTEKKTSIIDGKTEEELSLLPESEIEARLAMLSQYSHYVPLERDWRPFARSARAE